MVFAGGGGDGMGEGGGCMMIMGPRRRISSGMTMSARKPKVAQVAATPYFPTSATIHEGTHAGVVIVSRTEAVDLVGTAGGTAGDGRAACAGEGAITWNGPRGTIASSGRVGTTLEAPME